MERTAKFLLMFIIPYEVAALKCYTCTYNNGETDVSCLNLNNLTDTGITDCDKRYCTSQRSEYLNPSGVLDYMYRGCADNPIFINQVHEDGTNRIWYRTCQTDLCNSGDGKNIYNNGGGTLYVPGIGSGGIMMGPPTLNFICAVITILILIASVN